MGQTLTDKIWNWANKYKFNLVELIIIVLLSIMFILILLEGLSIIGVQLWIKKYFG